MNCKAVAVYPSILQGATHLTLVYLSFTKENELYNLQIIWK